ncbi:hypothetical protein BLNAU_19789 [Blattamonas nauphoetae]|uniref:Uncharacterized protein n=1 Tax=Blattamonas nauphoetae TaxID=2049346 RepID=A0ABQ9X125_9EUKA|nr:hypothetical protein BLNAU_19789 [Blattamonas nauphoetae]
MTKTDPLHSVSSSQGDALLSTILGDENSPPFGQTPDDESIATQDVTSEFASLHPSTHRSVQSDDSQSTCVNSDQSTSASITLQTELPPSEDTDPLWIESASIVTHSLSTRLHSAADSDEAMAIVKLLHSLQSAPPIAHTITDPTFPLEAFNLDDLEEDETFDVTERFSVSLFDEDDESLFKSLSRCSRVCDLVPPDRFIDDIPAFVDMLVSSLDSTHSITDAASNILNKLLTKTLNINDFIQNHWKKLRTAFQDGSHGAHVALLHVIMLYASNRNGVQSAYPSLYQDFDLEGIVSADLPLSSLLVAISALVCVKMVLSQSYDRNYVNSLFLSFEKKQHALARIKQFLIDGSMDHNGQFKSTLITFCLILSLHIGLPLQPDLFDYILNYPNLHSTLVETHTHPFLLLSHTSINHHAQKQKAFLMQLLLERTLRSDPNTFFLVDNSQKEDFLPLSFKSPFLLLPHIISHFPDLAQNIDPWDLQQRSDIQVSILLSATATTKNDIVVHVSELAITLGLLYPILDTSSASVYSRCGLTTRLCNLLISPVPSVVSLVLAFLARLVRLSDEEGKMEMVQLGVIDCVVVAVSQSSFLEDYENGIALIGDLLRAVRQDEQSQRMTLFDFAPII